MVLKNEFQWMLQRLHCLSKSKVNKQMYVSSVKILIIKITFQIIAFTTKCHSKVTYSDIKITVLSLATTKWSYLKINRLYPEFVKSV